MMSLGVLRRCASAAALGLLLTNGCSKAPPEGAAQAPTQVAASPSGESTASNHTTKEGSASQPGDLTPPTIDCPLRNAGVDPQHLKPFADVQKYVAFLERPDRTTWQKPDEVVRALHLTGNEIVADVGAGSGYFTFRFAAALPQGRVAAIDIEPEMIRHIHHKAMAEGIQNVEPVLASASIISPVMSNISRFAQSTYKPGHRTCWPLTSCWDTVLWTTMVKPLPSAAKRCPSVLPIR